MEEEDDEMERVARYEEPSTSKWSIVDWNLNKVFLVGAGILLLLLLWVLIDFSIFNVPNGGIDDMGNTTQ